MTISAAARDTIIKALITGPDPAKTATDLTTATRLPRATVQAVLAGLAAEDRLMRSLSDVHGRLTVRWSLKR